MTAARSRATVRRHPERVLPLPESAEEILSRALVAHVGTVQDGQPYVIPFTFLYRDGRVYLHGAHASSTMKRIASGSSVCVEVTLVDALIASKSAESHSVNYSSVVLFGRGQVVRDEPRRREIFTELISRYFPGRTAGEHYAPITDQESKATMLVEVLVEDVSAKGREGGPRGDFDADPSVPGDARIVPIEQPLTQS